jgi:hypothetical protein
MGEALSTLRSALAGFTALTPSLALQWGIAAVLLASGVVKLRHPSQAAIAVHGFGLVKTLNPAYGRAAGGVEASIAIGLIVTATYPTTSAARSIVTGTAFCLFVAFSVLIAYRLRKGDLFPCGCFGVSEALSTRTLFRAVAFAAIAASPLISSLTSGVQNAEIEVRTLAAVVGIGSISVFVLAASFAQLYAQKAPAEGAS